MRRSDFPFFQENPSCIYLDSAATTHKPASVIKAMNEFYTSSYATVHRAIYEKAKMATERYEDVRAKVCRFIGAQSPSEIIFTRGTTDSLNLVALAFGKRFLKRGDKILISPIEHHSNIVPWQLLQEEIGIVLDTLPIDTHGEIILSELEKKLTPDVKLISVAHVSNITGSLNPIEKIISLAHAKGIRVCVDGAQAVAHLPLNVTALGADFYAFSAHKMYGPTGVGVLYGKKELLEKMPPVIGGGDMIDKVTLAKTTFAPAPFRFEAGTPMIAEVIGLGAAIDYIESIGLDTIAKHEKTLLDHALERLSSMKGLNILGAPKHPIITFTLQNLHPLDIATLLDLKHISLRSGHLCSQPAMAHFGTPTSLRISFSIYNTVDEVDHFVSALGDVIIKMSS